MRTTVNLDEVLLTRAKKLAQETGVTLGDVVERSLQLLFTTPASSDSVELPSFSGGGLMPGIDYTSNASMFDAIEDDVAHRRRAGLDR